MSWPPSVCLLQMVDYILYTQPYLFMGVLCHLCPSILLNVLWHLVAHQHLPRPIFHFIGIFIFIFWTAFFHCRSPYSHNFHILLHCLFFLPNSNLFMVFFNLIFLGAFPRDGFTCFIYAIFYFLSIAEHFVTKSSPEFSVLFLYQLFYKQ